MSLCVMAGETSPLLSPAASQVPRVPVRGVDAMALMQRSASLQSGDQLDTNICDG